MSHLSEAPSPTDRAEGAQPSYDADYYEHQLGPQPYDRSEAWLRHFGNVADGITRMFGPRTVLDVGCAFGLLVEQLWDRGVRAEGVDVSAYAISQARPDVAPYMRVARATEPLGGPFDLITCLEVLEHLPAAEIEPAIASLTAASEVILFSSTPDDFAEPTHVSVRPPLAWISAFADAGFAVDLSADATFIGPHALVFRRSTIRQSDELQGLCARLVRERVLADRRFGAIQAAIHDGRSAVDAVRAELNAATERMTELQAEREALNSAVQSARTDLQAADTSLESLGEQLRAGQETARALRGRVRDLEQRSASLSGRALSSEAAVELMERALGRAVDTLEGDAQATRDAVLSMDRSINRVITSAFWRFKRRLTRPKA